MDCIGKMAGHRRIQCVPTSTENYISFSVGSLRFIDSMLFLNASLAELVSNSDPRSFHHLRKHFDEHYKEEGAEAAEVDLVLRKGVYPYDYMDCMAKFHETELPPKAAFYNVLKDKQISDDEYEHARKVWDYYEIKNLGEYHDLYMICDLSLIHI